MHLRPAICDKARKKQQGMEDFVWKTKTKPQTSKSNKLRGASTKSTLCFGVLFCLWLTDVLRIFLKKNILKFQQF